jgi:hypothetical protein
MLSLIRKRAEMTVKESKTQHALRMLRENPHLSAYAVSKIVGISQSVISRALAVEKHNDLNDASIDEPRMNPSFDEKRTELNEWFDLADIHRDKNMTDVYSSYRGRIARTHPQYVRHFDVPTQESGRPRRVTLLTAAGVRALYAIDEAPPNLKPYAPPMRLTDKARPYIVELGRFTTEGLERKMRILDRDQFIEFLVTIKNEDLIEPDFVPL